MNAYSQNAYSQAVFEEKLAKALERIREVLEDTKLPVVASDVHHLYEDKFLLAEMVTAVALAAERNLLDALGLDGAQLAQVKEWDRRNAIVLALAVEERCDLDRTEEHEVETGTRRRETKTEGVFGTRTKTVEEKVIDKVEKHYWSFRARYELAIVSRHDPERKVSLVRSEGRRELVTTSDKPPRPRVTLKPEVDVHLRPLLDALDDSLRCGFTIDREHASCHTPSRNDEIEAALAHFAELQGFCDAVYHYFTAELFGLASDHDRDMSMISGAEIFVPVLPLFREPADDGASAVLDGDDVHSLLAHQERTLREALERLSRGFSDDGTLLQLSAARLSLAALVGAEIAKHYAGSVRYIERMLEQQLQAAIGKSLTVADFSEYMLFHARKLFAPAFSPAPFHHAIRRPDHVPEGVISIESGSADGAEPISTFVRTTQATAPMYFVVNAATKVAFFGERHIHGWVSHQFAGSHLPALWLMARAREFSSFILLVGRIASAELFEPKAAIVIQNKDDLRIPLMLEQVPTPKEFKDAIASLSPEQQRFARAYRSMQLESTLFGLCVVQIKPQLERLLRLPEDSLTKEIKLTQQLLELFIRYQIPSDLLSYAGDAEAPPEEKVGAVAGHVARMLEMLQEQKDAALAAQRQQQAQQFAEMKGTLAMQVTHVTGSAPVPSAVTPWAAGPPPGPPPPMPPPAAPAGFGPPPPAPAPRQMAAPPPPPTAPPRTATLAGAAAMATPSPAAQPFQTAATAATARPERVTGHVAPAKEAVPSSSSEESEDYTRIPVELDRQFERLDEDSALRPTIIDLGQPWTMRRRVNLLSEPERLTLAEDEQRKERDRAFDLLDALSRSGSLPLHHASLHVVVAATHHFDKTLTATVIQRNVNPIEKVERSALIVASTIHHASPEQLTRAEQHERLESVSPKLFASFREDDEGQ